MHLYDFEPLLFLLFFLQTIFKGVSAMVSCMASLPGIPTADKVWSGEIDITQPNIWSVKSLKILLESGYSLVISHETYNFLYRSVISYFN